MRTYKKFCILFFIAHCSLANSIQTISISEQQKIMSSSTWHSGCPVPMSQLRAVFVPYYGFDKQIHQGELIVNQSIAQSVLQLFNTLASMHFPIRQIQPMENFNGDDELSMEADNTSAFNCRTIKGSDKYSWHAYGLAIDINPKENPSVNLTTGEVDPKNAVYSRGKNPPMGTITQSIVNLFAKSGWNWGGNWHAVKDYQHFEKGLWSN